MKTLKISRIRTLCLAVCLMLVVFAFTACGKDSGSTGNNSTQSTNTTDTSTDKSNNDTTTATDKSDSAAKTEDTVNTADTSATDTSDNAGAVETDSTAVTEVSADAFTVETETADGYSVKDGIYTITKGGEYKFTGTLTEGQIRVEASGEEVTIALAGVTISSKEHAVIYVEDAEEVTIKAVNETVNVLNDNRPAKGKNDDSDEAGNACIYSKDDLSIQGKGSLLINASYNKGIHCKNDVKIKNLSLTVVSVGTSIQGNDSIKIESGVINVTSTDGDGLKTKNTDVSSKGKQRGDVTIETGIVTISAADDCIQAANEIKITEGSDTVVTQTQLK